jgi:hypothetical protein
MLFRRAGTWFPRPDFGTGMDFHLEWAVVKPNLKQ